MTQWQNGIENSAKVSCTAWRRRGTLTSTVPHPLTSLYREFCQSSARKGKGAYAKPSERVATLPGLQQCSSSLRLLSLAAPRPLSALTVVVSESTATGSGSKSSCQLQVQVQSY